MSYLILPIPEELNEFIKYDGARSVPFEGTLKNLFKKMIEAYYEIEDVTTTRFKHEALANDISKYAVEQQVTNTKRFIKPTTIIEYYTGIPASKRKLQLLIIYKYLDKKLQEKNPEKGGRWFLDLIKNPLKTSSQNNPIINVQVLKNVKGAKEITREFLFNIKQKYKFRTIDFYLSKDNDNCQWFGIMWEWDKTRDIHDTIYQQITNSFKDGLNDDFLHVVLGNGGVGKSTVLRRLCADIVLYTDIKCFWIEDLKKTYDDLDNLEIEKKCILFIEDWERITNTEIEARFFHHVSNTTNLKLIIGDRPSEDRSYNVYRHANRIFKITTTDNADIIAKIVKIDTKIATFFEETISKYNLEKAPIYLILFTLIRANSTNNAELLEKSDTLLGKFKLIVQYDVEQLMSFNNIMGSLICAWAYVFALGRLQVMWESLVIIAGSQVPSDIAKFKITNPFCELLSYYISLEEFTYPIERGRHLVRFNHYLLADDGLSLPYLESGNNKQKINALLSALVHRFVQCKQWRAVATIVGTINPNESAVEWILSLPKESTGYSPMSHLVYVNKRLQFFYTQAPAVQGEQLWESYLIEILMGFAYFKKDYSTKLVLQRLVELGCTADCVKIALTNIQDRAFILNYLEKLIGRETGVDNINKKDLKTPRFTYVEGKDTVVAFLKKT